MYRPKASINVFAMGITKGNVCKKLKGVKTYGEKLSMVVSTNLSYICFVYKEKFVLKERMYFIFSRNVQKSSTSQSK